MSVYPNPSDGFITIELFNAAPQRIEIVDILGRQIWLSNMEVAKMEVNLSRLDNGVYVLRAIFEGNQVRTAKFTVQK